jgi:hypothetical protein
MTALTIVLRLRQEKNGDDKIVNTKTSAFSGKINNGFERKSTKKHESDVSHS